MCHPLFSLYIGHVRVVIPRLPNTSERLKSWGTWLRGKLIARETHNAVVSIAWAERLPVDGRPYGYVYQLRFDDMVMPGDGPVGRLILVVDDDHAILLVVSDILEDEGFMVHRAPDGRQALVLAREAHPDLILTDLMMPGMDGRALYSKLQEHMETAQIPVVLMSAAGHIRLGDGFVGFIPKPFNIDALLDEIRRHFT